MAISLNDIIKTARDLGYTIDTRPYKLNLIGVRNSKATNQDTFDDSIAYFYYDDKGKLIGKVVPATTDPSTYWLNKPKDSSKGAAILKSGEYKNAYSIGSHRGKYNALVQVNPVTTIRDNDRNSFINYLAPTTTGVYGINIHRATIGKNNVAMIDQDSAGCQVFRDFKDFNQMMQLASQSRDKYGNTFSYILIDERDAIKTRNTLLLGAGLLLIAGAIYFYTKK